MEYNLVKKLKDAGFPQTGNSSHWWHDKEVKDYNEGKAYIPTLSELIEAMPKRIKYLDGLINDAIFELQKMWCLSGKIYRARLNGDFESDDIAKEWSFNCETPEEAVARLWLALQKVNP